MGDPSPKRVKITIEHPVNLLFSTWLKQWKLEAQGVEGHMKNTVNKALKSLSVYPLALKSGAEAKILNGFGEFLCTRLDKELNAFKLSHGDMTLQKVKRYIKIEKGNASSLYNKKSKNDKTTGKVNDKDASLPAPAATISHVPQSDTSPNSMPPPKPKSSFFKRVFSDICDDEHSAKSGDVEVDCSNLHAAESRHILTARSKSLVPPPTPSIAPLLPRPPSFNDKMVPNLPASSLTVVRSDSHSAPQFSLPGGHFSIQLIVDYSEKLGKSTVTDELTKLGVNFREERLATGDYLWVARSHTQPEEQLVLDVIVERKRIDDLAHSITDRSNRYREQKVRLKLCGVRNVVFLIEKHAKSKRLNVPIETLYQAISNTQIHDEFYIKMTENGRDTAAYLASVTRKLIEKFSARNLQACSRENLPDSLPLFGEVPLQTLTELQCSSAKSRPVSLQELLLRQLMVVRGMTGEKAYAIVNQYQSFANLRMVCEKHANSTASNSFLSDIAYGSGKKKIGPVLSKQIFDFMLYN